MLDNTQKILAFLQLAKEENIRVNLTRIQKYLYFYGVIYNDRSLTFKLDNFGPYNAGLNVDTKSLINVGFIDKRDELGNYLELNEDKRGLKLYRLELEHVQEFKRELWGVIERIGVKGTVKEIELLSTVHYIVYYLEKYDHESTLTDVIEKFKVAKGEKFKDHEIEQGLNELIEKGLVAEDDQNSYHTVPGS